MGGKNRSDGGGGNDGYNDYRNGGRGYDDDYNRRKPHKMRKFIFFAIFVDLKNSTRLSEFQEKK